MKADQIPTETRIFNSLCCDWIAQTSRPPEYLHEPRYTAGEAACEAISPIERGEERLLGGPPSLWFAEGVDLGIAIAAAVARDPLGDPKPAIEHALRAAKAELEAIRKTVAEDNEIERRRARRPAKKVS